MKILHVINSMAAGGAEKLVSNLASEQSLQQKVGVFTLVNTSDVFFDHLNDKVSVHRAEGNSYYTLNNLLRLYKTIKSYDVIHVHLFPSFYLAGILSLLFSNKTFVYTEHSTHNKRRSKKFYIIEKLIYSRYQTIICISKSVEKNLKAWMGESTPTLVIENFLDLKEIKNQNPVSRESLNLSTSDKVLVMVGSFRDDNTKDQITVIRALQQLPENYKLLLLGQGVLRKKTEDFVQVNKLSDRVQFLGFRPDVYAVLKSCDFGILSSNWEGFGIALIEYMACGLLAFGTNVEGLRDLIISPQTAFEVGDDKSLAQKIRTLDNNPQQTQNLINKQNQFIKKFSLAQSVKQHQEVYAQV